MTGELLDDFLRDQPWPAIALAGFVQAAVEAGGWPEPEAARRHAYRWYEEDKKATQAKETL